MRYPTQPLPSPRRAAAGSGHRAARALRMAGVWLVGTSCAVAAFRSDRAAPIDVGRTAAPSTGRVLLPAGPILGRGPTSSDACGLCHKDIYRTWRGSAHARALEDPIFLDAFRVTEERDGTAVSRACLRCHAPLAEVAGDPDLRQRITWEGVSCDVCHSLVRVDLAGGAPRLELDVGPVKRGPIRDAASGAHEVAFSELHTTSLGCAGCHEWVSAEGVPIMSTYSEWRASSASRAGIECQACHMARTRAHVVDPRVQRTPHAEVNLHDVPGGHSLDQLHKALAVTLHPSRQGDELRLDVRIANKGAGHAVPTGMPGRRVILDLQVRTSQGVDERRTTVYGRTYLDAAGQPITRDSGHFAKGVRLVEDTRLMPDERREERFRFPVPAAAIVFVTVKLHYEHSPMGGEENRTFLTFLSEERLLGPAEAAGGSEP